MNTAVIDSLEAEVIRYEAHLLKEEGFNIDTSVDIVDTGIKIYEIQEETAPYSEFCPKTFAATKEVDLLTVAGDLDLLHICMGLAGELLETQVIIEELEAYESRPQSTENSEKFYAGQEVIELRYKALMKEFGDLCYYTQMLFNAVGIPMVISDPEQLPDLSPNITLEQILNTAKKKIFYKHQVQVLPQQITNWWEALQQMMVLQGFTPAFVILQNRRKLSDRYRGLKFTPEEAEAKNDERSGSTSTT